MLKFDNFSMNINKGINFLSNLQADKVLQLFRLHYWTVK